MECDFACSTKEEMDRHVYFHAFHGKIKSIGVLLMEEGNVKVSMIIGPMVVFSCLFWIN